MEKLTVHVSPQLWLARRQRRLCATAGHMFAVLCYTGPVPRGGGRQLTALIHWELNLCVVCLTMDWLRGSRRWACSVCISEPFYWNFLFDSFVARVLMETVVLWLCIFHVLCSFFVFFPFPVGTFSFPLFPSHSVLLIIANSHTVGLHVVSCK